MKKNSTMVAVVAALCVALTATAQPSANKNVEPPVPPTTNKLEDAGIVVPYMIAFLLIGAIGAIGAIPSKRGHQD